MMLKLTTISLLVFLLLTAAACGSKSGADPGKVIKGAPVGNNLSVELSSPSGVLKHGGDQLFLTFKDSSGKPVEVGAVALNFYMSGMGAMPPMNDATTFSTTETPGIYQGKVKIEMAGEWQAQITYEGPAGKGQATIPVPVQ